VRNKVIKTIEKYNLINNGDNIIVALSGGADSVSLLYVLISLKEQYNLTISAAHLNHQLRGEESVRDYNFVKNLCNSLDIKLFYKEVDINALSKETKESTELCGRNARYDFFQQLSNEHNAKIATAHTASDNLETVIYNIARGTSINGLKGIVPKRNYIIRPLINVNREDVENFCTENSISYVNDSTNFLDDYTRNKIRHNVIPVLKNINSNAETSATYLSEDAFEVTELLENMASEALDNSQKENKDCYDTNILKTYPKVIQKYAAIFLCRKIGINNITRKQIEIMVDILNTSGEIDLNSGYKAVSSQNMFRIIKQEILEKNFEPVEITDDLKFNFAGKCYEISYKENNSCENIDDYSFLEQKLVIRQRKAGDFINFSKRNITKSLKKFLIEEKIPKESRDNLLMVACDSEILWLEGYGFFKTIKIGDKTLKITVKI
jgi:tRNA(Ile)-lysidine synthase